MKLKLELSKLLWARRTFVAASMGIFFPIAVNGEEEETDASPHQKPLQRTPRIPISALTIVPGRRAVMLASQRGIEIRSWPELSFQRIVPIDVPHVHDLAFSPDGTRLLIAGGVPGELGRVLLWSWPDQRPIQDTQEHRDVVMRVAWSADGQHWGSVGADHVCWIMTRDGEGKCVYDGHSDRVNGITFLDHTLIATAGQDNTVRLWNTSGQHQRTLDHHTGPIYDLALRPTTRLSSGDTTNQETHPDRPTYLATASQDRTVRIWLPQVGRMVRFARLPSVPRALSWTNNGTQLIVGCDDGMVRWLDFETLEVLATVSGEVGWINAVMVDDQPQRESQQPQLQGRKILVAGEAREPRLIPFP